VAKVFISPGLLETSVPGVPTSDTWYDRVVLSANDKYGDADDIKLDAVRHTGALDPNQEYTTSADFRLPLNISAIIGCLLQTTKVTLSSNTSSKTNNVGERRPHSYCL